MLCCKKKPMDKKPEPLVEYPDGGWGWFVCMAAFTTQFIVLGTMNNFGVMYVELLREFKVGKAEAAWVGSITYGMMFLLGPLGTTLCKKIGCRMTTIVGCSIASGACLLGSIAPNIYVMDLTYGLMFGIGASMCYFPTVIILGTYFNKKLSLANGLTSSGSGVGSLAMGPVLQELLSRFGMRNTMRISAAMMACIIIISLVYRPINTPFLNASKYDKEKEANKKKGISRFIDLSLFKNKAYLMWAGSLAFWMLGYFVPFVHLIRLATLQGVDMFKATLLIGMMSVGSTVGRLFFGKIADHPKINRLYLYQFSFLMIGISNTICPLMTTYVGLAFYATMFGFFEGCYVLLAPVLTGDIVGRNNMATGVGVLFALKSVPLTLGPPIAGFIYDTSNSYEVAFYIAGAVPIIAACMMFAIPFLMPKEQEDEMNHKHYGKFEVIMDEKEEDGSSGYDSQPRLPQMFIEPATPTLPPEALKAESLPQLQPLVHNLRNPKRLSGDHTELRPMTSIPKHLRPKSVHSFASINGSHLSVNSILSRSGPSTYTLNALPPIHENSDHFNVRRSRVLELQKELSPSVFSLVRRRLELGAPPTKKTLMPKQISASKYGGSVGCISVVSDSVPIAYNEEVAQEEEMEKEIMVGKVSVI